MVSKRPQHGMMKPVHLCIWSSFFFICVDGPIKRWAVDSRLGLEWLAGCLDLGPRGLPRWAGSPKGWSVIPGALGSSYGVTVLCSWGMMRSWRSSSNWAHFTQWYCHGTHHSPHHGICQTSQTRPARRRTYDPISS